MDLKYNISLITLHTPTPENKGGASALSYHLLKYRDTNTKVKIYSFNLNNIPEQEINSSAKELDTEITILNINALVRFLRKKLSILIRFILNYPFLYYLKLHQKVIKEINSWSTHIWINGEDIALFANLFNKPCIITTPDSEALYYSRLLSIPTKVENFTKIIRFGRAYFQYLNLERHFKSTNCVYHLVGKADAEFLKKINSNLKINFIPHPHYEGNINNNIKFNQDKIKIIFPGRYDHYSKEAVDMTIEALSKHPEIAKYYSITFQGKNWDGVASILKNNGFDVHLKGFVPVYKDELSKHDIQISPISLGTGTKGKVLDAFINGLLLVGTDRAVENILVEDKADYLFYNNGEELIKILAEIPMQIEHFENVAHNGKKTVIEHHNPAIISKSFFKLFK